MIKIFKTFSKYVQNKRRKLISKASYSLFSDYLRSSIFKIFNAVLPILKTANFNLPENV